jgi:hypothetical protein
MEPCALRVSRVPGSMRGDRCRLRRRHSGFHLDCEHAASTKLHDLLDGFAVRSVGRPGRTRPNRHVGTNQRGGELVGKSDIGPNIQTRPDIVIRGALITDDRSAACLRDDRRIRHVHAVYHSPSLPVPHRFRTREPRLDTRARSDHFRMSSEPSRRPDAAGLPKRQLRVLASVSTPECP